MSITLKEIIKDTKYDTLPKDIRDNLMTLLERVNRIRDNWGHAMTVTSGLRTMKEHLEIYAKKGITEKAKIPMKSAHLSGAACDIYDPSRNLQAWCLAHENILESVGLWCENFNYTPSWVHFQCVPPKSGSRFFIP